MDGPTVTTVVHFKRQSNGDLHKDLCNGLGSAGKSCQLLRKGHGHTFWENFCNCLLISDPCLLLLRLCFSLSFSLLGELASLTFYNRLSSGSNRVPESQFGSILGLLSSNWFYRFPSGLISLFIVF